MLRWKLMPQVCVVAGGIAQRPERNRELGASSRVVGHRVRTVQAPSQLRLKPPTRTRRTAAAPPPRPAAALPFVGHLAVVLDAGRVGAEDEAVLAVAVGVEDHPEAVGVVERRVAARVGHDDARRVAVVQTTPM